MTMLINRAQFLAILYHDLFDYPLTEEELNFWQMGGEDEGLFSVEKTGRYWHLAKRRKIVLKRIANAEEATRKLVMARKASRVLRMIPTIRMVAVTGSCSMGNTRREDDIDLMLVTSKDCLWITRLASLLLLASFGFSLRRFGDQKTADKLCLNLWLDEENLGLASRADVYTAHELLAMKVLFDRGVYKKFVKANSWARKFFPEAFKASLKVGTRKPQGRGWGNFVPSLLALFEPLALFVQKAYMGKKLTKEKIGPGIAFFHPLPWRQNALSSFNLLKLEYAQYKDS